MADQNPEDLIKAAAKVAEEVKIAAKVVSDAVHNAEVVREQAAKDAAYLLLDAKNQNTKTLADALRDTFGEQEESQRFIDTKRIPLICKDISNISKSLETLHTKLDEKFVTKESFWPVKTLVYSAVGIILFAVFSALVYLVIIK